MTVTVDIFDVGYIDKSYNAMTKLQTAASLKCKTYAHSCNDHWYKKLENLFSLTKKQDTYTTHLYPSKHKPLLSSLLFDSLNPKVFIDRKDIPTEMIHNLSEFEGKKFELFTQMVSIYSHTHSRVF